MKNHLLLLVLFFLGTNTFGQIEQKTLSEAVEQGAIECTIQGRWDGIRHPYYDPNGQYFGKCMTIIMKNVLDDSLAIIIKAGQLLVCDDTSTQDMLITRDISVVLAKNATQNVGVYAMCSEIHDNVPWKKKKYKVGEMADENLKKIASAINDMWMQNICGQGAVWAYTDNASEEDLVRYGADSISLATSRQILNHAGVSTPFHGVDTVSLESVVEEATARDEVVERDTEEASNVNESILISLLTAGLLSFIAFLIYFVKFRKLKKTKTGDE